MSKRQSIRTRIYLILLLMLVLAINSNCFKTKLLREHNEPTSNAIINQSTINPDLLLFPGELRYSCEKINLDALTRISRNIPRQDITFFHSSSNMDINFSTTPKDFVYTPNMLTAGIVHHNPIIPISITSEMDIIIFVLIIINVSMFILFWLINSRKQYLRKLHLERIDNGYFSILLRETELKIPCLKLFSIHKDLNKYSATASSSSSQDLLETKFKDHFLQNINSLLDRNMDDHQFGITQLCKDMGISRAQIYRRFKGYSGMNVWL